MRNYLNLLLVILSIFVSCTNTNKKQDIEKNGTAQLEKEKKELFQIDPRTFDDKELNLADFAADIDYVPLANKIRLGPILTHKISTEAIYVVSDKSGGGEGNGYQELFRFDKYGRNPVQIGRTGKGPHEYLSCNLFAVDEPNNRIYISGKVHTVLVFDTLGNYIREFKFQNFELSFAKLDILSSNKLLLPQSKLGAKGSFLWYVIDTLGNVISIKNNSTPQFETQTGPHSGTFKYNNKISYWVDYNDTIFEISPDLTFHASYIIALDEPRIDELKLQSPTVNLFKPSEHYKPRFFIETNKYLINRYSYKGEYAFTFIEKGSRKTFTCNYNLGKDVTGGIVNDFDAGLMFFPIDYSTDVGNEYLSAIIQPFELKTHVATDEFKNSTPKYPEKKKELEKLANSLNENDNPVLMLVKLKE